MRIDGGLVAGDDDRIVGEDVAADGARLDVFRIGVLGDAQGEVDGVHRCGAVGDVINFDSAGVLQYRGGAEGEVQRGVVANAGGGIGGRESGDGHDRVDGERHGGAVGGAGAVHDAYVIAARIGGHDAGNAISGIGGVGNLAAALVPLIGRGGLAGGDHGEGGGLRVGNHQAHGLGHNSGGDEDGERGTIGDAANDVVRHHIIGISVLGELNVGQGKGEVGGTGDGGQGLIQPLHGGQGQAADGGTKGDIAALRIRLIQGASDARDDVAAGDGEGHAVGDDAGAVAGDERVGAAVAGLGAGDGKRAGGAAGNGGAVAVHAISHIDAVGLPLQGGSRLAPDGGTESNGVAGGGGLIAEAGDAGRNDDGEGHAVGDRPHEIAGDQGIHVTVLRILDTGQRQGGAGGAADVHAVGLPLVGGRGHAGYSGAQHGAGAGDDSFIGEAGDGWERGNVINHRNIGDGQRGGGGGAGAVADSQAVEGGGDVLGAGGDSAEGGGVAADSYHGAADTGTAIDGVGNGERGAADIGDLQSHGVVVANCQGRFGLYAGVRPGEA